MILVLLARTPTMAGGMSTMKSEDANNGLRGRRMLLAKTPTTACVAVAGILACNFRGILACNFRGILACNIIKYLLMQRVTFHIYEYTTYYGVSFLSISIFYNRSDTFKD